jgi:hypothetical protein
MNVRDYFLDECDSDMDKWRDIEAVTLDGVRATITGVQNFFNVATTKTVLMATVMPWGDDANEYYTPAKDLTIPLPERATDRFSWNRVP